MADLPATTMTAKQIEVVTPGYMESAYAVAFVDESQFVGGCSGGTVRRWKIEDRQEQGLRFGNGGTAVLSIAASQDGRWIVAGSEEVVVWNAVTHEKVHVLASGRQQSRAIDISSDSTKVAFTDPGAVRIFDITSGNPLLPPIPHSYTKGVKFSPDGSRIAAISSYCGFCVYNTRNGDILFDSGSQGSCDTWTKAPLAWSSDGQQIFVASKGKGTITCFDVSRSSKSKWSIHENRCEASIVSNGRFIACSAAQSVSFWDCVSRKQIATVITHPGITGHVALSPSGGYLASASGGKTITIYNLRDILPSEYFDHGRSDLTRPQLYASHLPLVRVSNETIKSWTQGGPTTIETLLSDEIASISSPSHYTLANRALMRVRLKHVALAIEDAKGGPSRFGNRLLAISQWRLLYLARAIGRVRNVHSTLRFMTASCMKSGSSCY